MNMDTDQRIFCPTSTDSPVACNICLTSSDSPITLRCNHRFCTACLRRCSEMALSSCPTCRRPHELNPDALRTRLDAYRQEYRHWRRGRARGVKGEITTIITAPAAPRSEPRIPAPAKKCISPPIPVASRTRNAASPAPKPRYSSKRPCPISCSVPRATLMPRNLPLPVTPPTE